MREFLITISSLALVAMTGQPATSQQWIRPPTPAGLTESPEMVLSQYLLKRAQVTRNRPNILMCDSEALALMSEGFKQQLINHQRANRIDVSETCPDGGTNSDAWLPQPIGADDYLVIISMSFGPLSSRIEAITGPRNTSDYPYDHGHREIFEWDHRRDIGGMVLIFTDFDEVRH